MGFFALEGMGYGLLETMGYGSEIPAHQVGGSKNVWGLPDYGFSRVWVITGSTVCSPLVSVGTMLGHRGRLAGGKVGRHDGCVA